MKPSATARRLLRWLVVVGMMACLPLQTVSALVADLLGSRHSHDLAFAVAAVSADPLADWRDFRRVQHDHQVAAPLQAQAQAHPHAHEVGARHHHDRGDPSVVSEDGAGLDAGAPADAPQANASFVFMAVDGVARIAPPSEAIGAAWRGLAQLSPPAPLPTRIERPPQGA